MGFESLSFYVLHLRYFFSDTPQNDLHCLQIDSIQSVLCSFSAVSLSISKLSIVTIAKACMCLTALDIFLVKLNIIKPWNAYVTGKNKTITS